MGLLDLLLPALRFVRQLVAISRLGNVQIGMPCDAMPCDASKQGSGGQVCVEDLYRRGWHSAASQAELSMPLASGRDYCSTYVCIMSFLFSGQ